MQSTGKTAEIGDQTISSHFELKVSTLGDSTRSSHKDLHKVLQGPLRLLEDFTWFRQDLYKIFSQEVVKDLDHDLHARTPKRISQDPQQKIKGLAAGEDLTRS